MLPYDHDNFIYFVMCEGIKNMDLIGRNLGLENAQKHPFLFHICTEIFTKWTML